MVFLSVFGFLRGAMGYWSWLVFLDLSFGKVGLNEKWYRQEHFYR